VVVEEGSVIAGKYRLERAIARGGMGSVWLARQVLLDTEVAIKFMDPGIAASDAARQRFEREARASLVIKSPHVVQVLDYGVEGDTPYIAMELLEGESLGDKLDRVRKMSPAEAYGVLEPMGKALRRAHEVGLVHRDLKPGNVFLARSGRDEIVKVLDFGIAKQVTLEGPTSVTTSGALLGSPLYMSPEQVMGSKEIDHRSDLWSAAIILYEMLVGRTPFDEHHNIGKLLVAICTHPIEPPSLLAPELGPEVDAFFERALAREPGQRFQSATEMVEAFEAVCGAKSAVRPGPLSTVVPSSGRHSDPYAQTMPGEPSSREGLSLPVSVSMPDSPPTPVLERQPPTKVSPGRGSAPPNTPAKASPVKLASPAREAAALASTLPSPTGTIRPPSPSQADPKSTRPARAFMGLALVGAGAAVAVIAMLGLRHQDPTPTEPTVKVEGAPPPTATVTSTAPEEQSARLAIEPKDAVVEIDGRAAVVEGGFVTLQGTLGSTHRVRLSRDGQSSEVEVAITASGVLPAKVALAGVTDPVVDKQKPRVDPVTSRAGTSATAQAKPPPTTNPTAHPITTTKSKDPPPDRVFE
jgi:serine/threonine-protein kinase